MKNRIAKIQFLPVLLLLVLALAACAGKAPAQSPPSSAPDDVKLVSEGFMELEYAENFSVELYEGGYRMLRGGHRKDAELLIVPESMPVPADIADHVTVLQMPIQNVYIASSGLVSLIDAIDALDHVKLVSYEADRWYLDQVVARMADGRIGYSGHYTTPDYELMTTNDIQLHIDTTKSDDYSEVLDKFAELNIPSFVENSSLESHPLGRVEWVKVFGVLFGKEAEAAAYFETQKALLEAAAAAGDSGRTVAMGYITSRDQYYARNASDYTVQLIEMAGGHYILSDLAPGESGSSSMTFEDWYIHNKDADCLFYFNFYRSFDSIQEMVEYNPLLADFKSVRNGAVWVTSPDFSQSTAAIASILSDMNTILFSDDPDVTTDHLIKLPES